MKPRCIFSALAVSKAAGLRQVLGENFGAAGFADVETMVQAMVVSEDDQFKAMAAFMKSNGLDHALGDHDWAGFARSYNGPNYAANNYDGLLADAFARDTRAASYPTFRSGKFKCFSPIRASRQARSMASRALIPLTRLKLFSNRSENL